MDQQWILESAQLLVDSQIYGFLSQTWLTVIMFDSLSELNMSFMSCV